MSANIKSFLLLFNKLVSRKSRKQKQKLVVIQMLNTVKNLVFFQENTKKYYIICLEIKTGKSLVSFFLLIKMPINIWIKNSDIWSFVG